MSRKKSARPAQEDQAGPALRDEAEESHDSADHVDWRRAERVRLPNLRPSTTSISLRLPVRLVERIKVAAHKRDVPFLTIR